MQISDDKKSYFISVIKHKSDGTFLGLDIGQKNIGIAKCHVSLLFPLPFSTLRRTGDIDLDIAAIASIARAEKVLGIVAGLPIEMDGTHGKQAESISMFVKALEAALQIPIAFYDERLSTRMADRLLMNLSLTRKERNKLDDKVAATLILEDFLKNIMSTALCKKQD